MRPEDLERVLFSEDDIVPSSGFVASVMETVIEDATAPPLTFPWRRAWPLAATVVALLVCLVIESFTVQAPGPGLDVYAWFQTVVPMATGWVAAGLLMAIAVTGWSLRLVRLR